MSLPPRAVLLRVSGQSTAAIAATVINAKNIQKIISLLYPPSCFRGQTHPPANLFPSGHKAARPLSGVNRRRGRLKPNRRPKATPYSISNRPNRGGTTDTRLQPAGVIRQIVGPRLAPGKASRRFPVAHGRIVIRTRTFFSTKTVRVAFSQHIRCLASRSAARRIAEQDQHIMRQHQYLPL